MTKEVLKNKLENSFRSVAANVENIEESKFFAPIGEKWSVAENILHLTQSVKMFNQAMALPKAFLKQQFGKIDRSKFSYDDTVAKYQEVLSTGVVARGAFVPVMPENPSKEILMNSFLKHHQTLVDFLSDWSEEDLDQYCVKHPVLKNLTIREFYYFMDYHTLHHKKAILRYDA